MTAPNTNVEKQAKRHRGPLVGIILAVVVAASAAYFFAGSDELNEGDATAPATATQ